MLILRGQSTRPLLRPFCASWISSEIFCLALSYQASFQHEDHLWVRTFSVYASRLFAATRQLLYPLCGYSLSVVSVCYSWNVFFCQSMVFSRGLSLLIPTWWGLVGGVCGILIGFEGGENCREDILGDVYEFQIIKQPTSKTLSCHRIWLN